MYCKSFISKETKEMDGGGGGIMVRGRRGGEKRGVFEGKENKIKE